MDECLGPWITTGIADPLVVAAVVSGELPVAAMEVVVFLAVLWVVVILFVAVILVVVMVVVCDVVVLVLVVVVGRNMALQLSAA